MQHSRGSSRSRCWERRAAIDADSKMIVSYIVGGHDAEYAMWLMDDLRSRLANRVQLTNDGHCAFHEAVEGAFEPTLITSNWSRCMGTRLRHSIDATAPQNARVSKSGLLKAVQIKALTARPMLNGKSRDADANASVYSHDECLLYEGVEPRSRLRPSHDVLKFRPHPQIAQNVVGHGRRCDGQPLRYFRYCYADQKGGNRSNAERARALQEVNFNLTHYP